MRRKERNELIAAQRMDQILAAARKVFAQHGFSRATTDEIAREAGVSPGLIFHYFKSKKELLVEVIAPLAVDSLTRSLSAAEGSSVEDLLVRFLQGHGEFMLQNQDLLKVIFSEAQFHEEVRELVVSRLLARGTGVLEAYFQRQVDAGTFRSDIDIQVTARAFIGLFFAIMALKGLFRDPVFMERESSTTYRQMVRLFLDGVRAP